jgi:hypothetical protein
LAGFPVGSSAAQRFSTQRYPERERILANIVSMMQVKADRGDQAHSEKSIEQLQKETAKAAQQEKK